MCKLARIGVSYFSRLCLERGIAIGEVCQMVLSLLCAWCSSLLLFQNEEHIWGMLEGFKGERMPFMFGLCSQNGMHVLYFGYS